MAGRQLSQRQLIIFFISGLILLVTIWLWPWLKTLTASGLAGTVQAWGWWGRLAVFALALLQGSLPVIPFFLLASGAGLAYGFWQGAVLVWSGAVLGCLFPFYLARSLGYQWATAFLARQGWHFRARPAFGFMAVLTGRLFPVVPSSVINVLAGLSPISAVVFLSATALGKLPWTLMYVGLGRFFTYREIPLGYLVLGVTLVLLGFGSIVWWRQKNRLLRENPE